jgi:hypothetical protein
MDESNPVARSLAIPPASQLPPELLRLLCGPIWEIIALICRFRDGRLAPRASYDFEQKLYELLREVGRVIVQWSYNGHEAGGGEVLPARLRVEGVWYRRNTRKTANRCVATLFGTITLMRFGYRPIDELVPGLFPLELRLGLEAARATPALADRVGRLAARCTQQSVLQTLRQDHGVSWSVHLLRKVTASLAEGMAGHRHTAQVSKVLALLAEAYVSRGDRKPTLAAGRDGIFVPIRKPRKSRGGKGGKGDNSYREGAVATLSVLDRLGKRLGTVYLARMPEEGQHTLSSQLTSLLGDVLREWHGALPRLAYVTDAGATQTAYFKNVLRRMRHPRTGEPLEWERVLDYYHSCQYVTKLAEALFGAGRDAESWAAKMRRWLKAKPKGIHRVLHSAAALRSRHGLKGTDGAFDLAYRYLSSRIGQLDYHGYRKLRLPIGSGVTEACCKTVFTQRLKQSGMSWHIEGGQTILDLRVVDLSGTWEATRDAYLRSKGDQTLTTQWGKHAKHSQKAA